MVLLRWRKLVLLMCMLLLCMTQVMDTKNRKWHVVKEEPEEEDEDGDNVSTGAESQWVACPSTPSECLLICLHACLCHEPTACPQTCPQGRQHHQAATVGSDSRQ